MHPELERAAQLATKYLQTLDDCRVDDALEPARLRDRLAKELTTEGVPSQQVIEELFDDAGAGLLNTSSGRFFGWVIGGALPVSIAAEWLTAAWDQNAGASALSPSAAIVEEVAGRWLKDILRLQQNASFGFVTGCQMVHFTALAAARHRVLRDKGWDVEAQGLAGSPRSASSSASTTKRYYARCANSVLARTRWYKLSRKTTAPSTSMR